MLVASLSLISPCVHFICLLDVIFKLSGPVVCFMFVQLLAQWGWTCLSSLHATAMFLGTAAAWYSPTEKLVTVPRVLFLQRLGSSKLPGSFIYPIPNDFSITEETLEFHRKYCLFKKKEVKVACWQYHSPALHLRKYQ